MNLVTLIGRAGRDPEVRYFESGTMVANLSLAVNPSKRDEAPDWFNLEIWGRQAQVAADYVRKGGLIAVYGRINQQKWTDRTSGEEKSKWVVTVDRLELLSSKRDSQQENQQQPAASTQYSRQASPASRPTAATAPATGVPVWQSNGPISDEEVPF